jgi:hypothetical protein
VSPRTRRARLPDRASNTRAVDGVVGIVYGNGRAAACEVDGLLGLEHRRFGRQHAAQNQVVDAPRCSAGATVSHLYIHICTHRYTRTHTHIYVYVYIYVCVYVCMCVCMYVCVCIYIPQELRYLTQHFPTTYTHYWPYIYIYATSLLTRYLT